MPLPDFDILLNMAQQDPKALEQLRREKSEQLIQQAPSHAQRRLRGLLFQIESQQSLHSCAMGACIALSNLMHRSFARLPDMLKQLNQTQSSAAPNPINTDHTATIINFKTYPQAESK